MGFPSISVSLPSGAARGGVGVCGPAAQVRRTFCVTFTGRREGERETSGPHSVAVGRCDVSPGVEKSTVPRRVDKDQVVG